VGCDLEDSRGEVLKDPHARADRLAEVVAEAGGSLFVDARIDTFVRGVVSMEAAISRAAPYVAAGADCVYPTAAPPVLRAGVRGPINALGDPADGPGPAESGAREPPA